MGEQAASASECPAGRLHFNFEIGIVEVLPLGDDPRQGRLVCTTLVNEAMPFVRYDIQDVVRLSEEPCPCGRAGVTAESIDGRIESYVKTPAGSLVGRLDHIFKDLHGIRESQIIQKQIDRLVVKVVKSPTFAQSDEQRLAAEFRQRLGAWDA